jgi:chromatin remodeling complex protein RSC6
MTLSPALAAIVGAKKDEKLARSEIVKRLWAYLKEKNLQVHYSILNSVCRDVFPTDIDMPYR